MSPSPCHFRPEDSRWPSQKAVEILELKGKSSYNVDLVNELVIRRMSACNGLNEYSGMGSVLNYVCPV